MSEVTLSMSLPLDSDGFLRRECPGCERQFKWRPTPPDAVESSGDINAESEGEYFCPYCHQPAATGAWWTQEQVAFARELATAEIVGPQLRDLRRSVEDINRGGFLRTETELTIGSRPEPLTEPDDMIRIDTPCHPEEPLKVDETWDDDVACLVCGIRYPVELVRALPDGSEEA